MKSALLLSLLLAACGGDDTNTPVDSGNGSGSGSGSGANKVVTVSCTGATVAATVTTTTGVLMYTYSGGSAPTIPVNGIVEFKTSADHDVNPATTGGRTSDPGLKVGFSKDVCLKFTEAGNFDFYCSVHTFFGKITVQ